MTTLFIDANYTIYDTVLVSLIQNFGTQNQQFERH
jgi:hypothetical protein